MYEGTAGTVNAVFQALDEVMKKESSLFQEQAASVARALDQMTTFRTQSAAHKQLFESAGFSNATYFNDILRLDNDMHGNLHEHVLPALRYIADTLQTLAQGEQARDSSLTVLQNSLALHINSVEKLLKPAPPPAPQASPVAPSTREVTLSDESITHVQDDGDGAAE